MIFIPDSKPSEKLIFSYKFCRNPDCKAMNDSRNFSCKICGMIL